MTNSAVHCQQAAHNESVAKTLNNASGNTDWVITVCFYSALHLIEAALDRDLGVHPEKTKPPGSTIHSHRKNYVRTYYRKIYPEYEKLFSDSIVARYLTDDSTGGVTLKKCSYEHFNQSIAEQRLDDLARIRSELFSQTT
jgi:hypothetical protein